MAGILNKTARQYNLKCIGKGKERVTVRVAPGFNVVDDDHWAHFKGDPYVKQLKNEGSIDFGNHVDDIELEMAPDTKSKSKVTPPVAPSNADKAAKEEAEKFKAEIKAEAKKEADKLKADAKAEADKIKADAQAEADKIKADAKAEADKGSKSKSKDKKSKDEDDEL